MTQLIIPEWSPLKNKTKLQFLKNLSKFPVFKLTLLVCLYTCCIHCKHLYKIRFFLEICVYVCVKTTLEKANFGVVNCQIVCPRVSASLSPPLIWLVWFCWCSIIPPKKGERFFQFSQDKDWTWDLYLSLGLHSKRASERRDNIAKTHLSFENVLNWRKKKGLLKEGHILIEFFILLWLRITRQLIIHLHLSFC